MIKSFKKYHKQLSLGLILFIILFALSGIVLNHRQTFSPIDVSRNILPQEYEYNNWNNAAVISTLNISEDSVLVFGNVGIWLTDSTFSSFTDFNSGFPSGIDNRKISCIVKTNGNELLAGTFFGLYKYSQKEKKWNIIELPGSESRITDILIKNDTIIVLTRSHLLQSIAGTTYSLHELPEPEGYTNKIGLFKTFWVIHSGEIYGLVGKLIVDLVAVIFIFLSITGLVLFFSKRSLKRKKKTTKQVKGIKSRFKWNLKWHNKIGWVTSVILIITTFTGIFLRPPLIAVIGNTEVSKIPYTELDTPNPWFDKLRRIIYDEELDRYVLATLDGMYYSDDEFKSELKRFEVQPPASVMGVTVFHKTNSNEYMVGSFEGLFRWNSETGFILDYIKKVPYVRVPGSFRSGSPIGEFQISGFSADYFGQEIIFDYNFGAANISKDIQFSEMPDHVIDASPMSLWNLSLEIHTARLYKVFMGNFYIMFIPFSGILTLIILISGLVVYLNRYFRKKTARKDLD